MSYMMTCAGIDEIDEGIGNALSTQGFGGIEPRGGARMPCTMILRQIKGWVAVSAVDPVASMQAIENAQFQAVAGQVRDLLAEALQEI
jgi:hypothetical protein